MAAFFVCSACLVGRAPPSSCLPGDPWAIRSSWGRGAPAAFFRTPRQRHRGSTGTSDMLRSPALPALRRVHAGVRGSSAPRTARPHPMTTARAAPFSAVSARHPASARRSLPAVTGNRLRRRHGMVVRAVSDDKKGCHTRGSTEIQRLAVPDHGAPPLCAIHNGHKPRRACPPSFVTGLFTPRPASRYGEAERSESAFSS